MLTTGYRTQDTGAGTAADGCERACRFAEAAGDEGVRRLAIVGAAGREGGAALGAVVVVEVGALGWAVPGGHLCDGAVQQPLLIAGATEVFHRKRRQEVLNTDTCT